MHLKDYVCASFNDIPNQFSSGTSYPISNFLTYSNISPSQYCFSLSLTIHTEPNTFNEASKFEYWNQAMKVELDALKDTVKMSRKVDSVKDINDSKETWRLAVRIMDVWSVMNNKGIEHLEMIVMDSLGDRIQVLIRHDHLLKWKEVIKENITCIINNGSVYNNDFQWKETLCVTVATTLKFAVSKYGWFYYGCTRYKIEIYVSNGESKYRFVFWDSECAAILGMTSEFMHNSMVENREDDPMVYPDELEMLLNKKMTFRVKVQPTFSQASVWKLCDDEAFFKEIENDYIVEDNQSKTEYAKLVPNKENLETSAQTLSASGENDPESIILMTPAKDIVIADKGEKVDFEASGATQLSGTKPSKKLKIEPSS
ncbi:hypothetical protein KIW84_075458 [Lathyrus oleraceus]|uniref:Replication protein A 70 kDa DNA-binding subunit B/D first OB fold domain-containing protein n=1 Tax=Pisum sativum TaxID=3888 RepID=A0A9D4VTR2_PEA|nr:hypothetical protein KIW84_075458 [Pisum sativum]